ncbi:MAG: rhomboid family intramembrane serine protease [Saprospiraceae bacterium]|nr:rhomboid family intramembrane serine protease [Saprospiraceae bacterium]
MIFPIGDDNVKGGFYPLFTYIFLAANVLIFLTTRENTVFNNTFSANPCELTAGQDLFTAFTSMFLHANFMHLLGNMLFLWIFADNIESTIGNLRFALFYILGGLAAVAVHLMIGTGGNCIPMVGASGAIAAVMGAYFVMFPKSRIKMLFFIKIFRIPAFLFLGLWIVQQIMSGFSQLPGLKDMDGGGVAFWAHIGGFVFGVLAGLVFKTRFPKISEQENTELSQPEYRSVNVPAKRYNNRF